MRAHLPGACPQTGNAGVAGQEYEERERGLSKLAAIKMLEKISMLTV
jgi:hypothetical protein